MTITVENRETPVLLLTGYLGSGKTTLVNRILSNRKGIKFAVIVNDIGEVNIDADLIQKGGVVDTTDDSLVPLQNGCICCTLKMDLVAQLNDLCRTNQFDYIVIEASGICEPAPIAQTICSFTKLVPEYAPTNVPKLDCIVTVVDALRMQSEFACGDSLKKDNLEEDDLENLVIQQIEFCNIVLLNKASEVKPEELGRVRGIVKALNPKVTILECDYGDIDLDKILNTKLFDFDKTATSAAWINAIEGEGNLSDQPEEDYGGHDEEHHGHPQEEEDDDHDKEHGHEEHEHEHEHEHHHHEHKHEGESEDEYGIGTFIYYRRKPFNREKLRAYVKNWPRNIIRCKGTVWFSDEDDMAYVLETSGRQLSCGAYGKWIASAPVEIRKKLLDENPQVLADWDPYMGDRMIRLCIIGQKLNKKEIASELDKLLD